MYPANGVIPELVSDVNLKRARTEINGKDAIRVVSTGTGTFTTDPQDFADGTGLAPATTQNGSVNYNLTTLASNAATNTTNTTSIATTLGTTTDTSADTTVIGLLKSISNKLTSF